MPKNTSRILSGLVVLLMLLPLGASAADLPLLKLTTNDEGSQTWSLNIRILVLMTVLTLIPGLGDHASGLGNSADSVQQYSVGAGGFSELVRDGSRVRAELPGGIGPLSRR